MWLKRLDKAMNHAMGEAISILVPLCLWAMLPMVFAALAWGAVYQTVIPDSVSIPLLAIWPFFLRQWTYGYERFCHHWQRLVRSLTPRRN